MKSQKELNQELRQRILALPEVTEKPHAGIHEDAFFVNKKMFMHIHGYGHCDICLPKDVQQRALAEGKARPHRWAPEQGYVPAAKHTKAVQQSILDLLKGRSGRHCCFARTQLGESYDSFYVLRRLMKLDRSAVLKMLGQKRLERPDKHPPIWG